MLTKSFFVVVVMVTLSNKVFANSDLESRITTMWSETNRLKTKLGKIRPLEIDQNLINELKEMNLGIADKLHEHYTKVEEEARLTGKLENINFDAIYMKYKLEGYRNSKLPEIAKQNIKNSTISEDMKTEINNYLDESYSEYLNNIEIIVKEMEKTPRNIFANLTDDQIKAAGVGTKKIINKMRKTMVEKNELFKTKLIKKGYNEDEINKTLNRFVILS